MSDLDDYRPDPNSFYEQYAIEPVGTYRGVKNGVPCHKDVEANLRLAAALEVHAAAMLRLAAALEANAPTDKVEPR